MDGKSADGQDVHEAALRSRGLRPGDILLQVRNKELMRPNSDFPVG